MDNENNKWEYDYSSLYNSNSSGQPRPTDSGYINVGSSGTNAANQYDAAPAEPAYGGPTAPEPPEKPRRRRAGRVLRSVLALVLAAAMGFAGGFAGSQIYGSPKIVLQSADRSEAASSAAIRRLIPAC